MHTREGGQQTTEGPERATRARTAQGPERATRTHGTGARERQRARRAREAQEPARERKREPRAPGDSVRVAVGRVGVARRLEVGHVCLQQPDVIQIVLLVVEGDHPLATSATTKGPSRRRGSRGNANPPALLLQCLDLEVDAPLGGFLLQAQLLLGVGVFDGCADLKHLQ